MSKPKLKLRMKNWYWGNYILEGQRLDSTLITRKTKDIELYDEKTHGWHNSEEYKTGYQLTPYHQPDWIKYDQI